MSIEVLSPFPFLTDRKGDALNLGYVYIGDPDQDPELFPKAVFWDEALTVPASQPLRTDNGYVVNGGAAAAFFTEGAYSIRVRERTGLTPGPQAFYRTNVPDTEDALIDALASSAGAGMIGYDPEKDDYPEGTLGRWAEINFPLTIYDFGAVGDGTTNDTAAYALLKSAYFTGHDVHWPQGRFLVDADVGEFTPPVPYNYLNYRPPAITASSDSYLIARTGGEYLMKLGTTAADYSGCLRDANFQLPVIDGDNKEFTKGALYAPFFLDVRIDRTVRNGGAWFGDTAAPGPSAGLKGTATSENELPQRRRDTTSITNAVNPVITFSAPHGLWPSTGRRCVALKFYGAPAGWSAIADKSLDVLITSATTVQLLNVDSTGYGAMAGFAACYLNLPSMRVPKRISGVTNANPCVITTAIPHLYTSGDLVDLAEIGGMSPDRYRAAPFTGLQGQFTITVLSATTFSIAVNTTSTATYGIYTSSSGSGWAMAWVPPADCDTAEYYDNATDIDSSEVFSKHYRIHQYHNPITSGFDGKHYMDHFYNFPEFGEALCNIWAGGDNHFSGDQHDGPVRYPLILDGPRNTADGCKTNHGYIDPRPQYGAFARGTSANSELTASKLGIKSRVGYEIWSDWSGPGNYRTDGTNYYSNVTLPIDTFGRGQIAAAATFSMVDGSLVANIQCAATFARTPGGFGSGDRVASFLRPVPLTSILLAGMPGGAAHASQAATLEEDTSWSARTEFERRFITRVGGTPTDLNAVPFTFIYSN